MMLESLKLEMSLKVLDVGCGQGDSSLHLKALGCDICYLDKTEKMIERGVRRGIIPEDRKIVHDIAVFPYPFTADSFHLITTRYAVHDIKEKHELFEEFKRLLKHGGKLQIVEMCAPTDAVKAFYNEYHRWKTTSEPIECWIPTREELIAFLDASDLSAVAESWYRSKVESIHWLKEGQINEDRHAFLKEYILKTATDGSAVKEMFRIERRAEGVYIEFPVVIITAQRN
jgi:ubiquinone/menaquinone biosynthesis C-methylase UbiE